MKTLKTILSITGKPGLFELISQGNRAIIVEDLATKKRFPALSRDKIVALGDISMYTDSGDKPLGEILDMVLASTKGEKIDVAAVAKNPGLKSAFGAIVEDFDRDRVHDSDIKKLFTWYNILRAAGFEKFTEEEEAPAEESKESAPKAEVEEK